MNPVLVFLLTKSCIFIRNLFKEPEMFLTEKGQVFGSDVRRKAYGYAIRNYHRHTIQHTNRLFRKASGYEA